MWDDERPTQPDTPTAKRYIVDTAYWLALYSDYAAAWTKQFGGQALQNTLLIAMSVAEHETNNGRAWPGTNNFGAVQLRPLTAQEYDRWQIGTLKAGDTFPGDPGGVLHIDTHPTPSGPKPYPVWFAAFAARVDGIAYFLATLGRLSGKPLFAPDATTATVAKAMYQHGYFEGAHAGARGVGYRVDPLNAGEQANVNDYAAACARILPILKAAIPANPPATDPETVAIAVAAIDAMQDKTMRDPTEPGDAA